MPQIAYVNGQYLPRRQGAVSIEDRGYQFADGVYQVMTLVNGSLIDEREHLDALDASLISLEISKPMERRPLQTVLRRVIIMNRVQNAHIYIQITRGTQKREALYREGIPSSLVIVVTPAILHDPRHKIPTITVITTQDERFLTRIKTLMRLPNVLSIKKAVNHGAQDVWMVKDGVVTEASSSNAWIVTDKGSLKTHPADDSVLNGITRQTLIKLAAHHSISVIEEPFTPEEAQKSPEAFTTASFGLIKAVTAIDGVVIGKGSVGDITRKLATIYGNYIYGKSS